MEKFYSRIDSGLPVSSVYGDGQACKRIVSIIKTKLDEVLTKDFEQEYKIFEKKQFEATL